MKKIKKKNHSNANRKNEKSLIVFFFLSGI